MGEGLLYLVTSFWLGAVHAATPGHGKTIAASYIVGVRGRPVDALVLGIFGFIAGGLFGFIVGALASFVLLPLGIGFATGILAYNLTQNLFHLYPVSILVGVVSFIVGIFLSMKLLSLATAVFGSLILFNVFGFFHFPVFVSAAVAILVGAAGFWIQGGSGSSQETKFVSWSRTPPPASAVSANTSPLQTHRTINNCPRCGTSIDNPDSLFCPNCGASLKG